MTSRRLRSVSYCPHLLPSEIETEITPRTVWLYRPFPFLKGVHAQYSFIGFRGYRSNLLYYNNFRIAAASPFYSRDLFFPQRSPCAIILLVQNYSRRIPINLRYGFRTWSCWSFRSYKYFQPLLSFNKALKNSLTHTHTHTHTKKKVSSMEHNIEEFLHHTQLIIIGAENALRNSPDDRNLIEYYEQRLDFLIDTLVRLLRQQHLHHEHGLQTMLHQLRTIRRFLLNSLERIDNIGVIHPDITSEIASGGRPLINVDADILVFLRELNFSWVQIASIVGVHPRTLYRRRQELQIEDTQGSFSNISDADLDELVRSLRDIHTTKCRGNIIARIPQRSRFPYPTRTRSSQSTLKHHKVAAIGTRISWSGNGMNYTLESMLVLSLSSKCWHVLCLNI